MCSLHTFLGLRSSRPGAARKSAACVEGRSHSCWLPPRRSTRAPSLVLGYAVRQAVEGAGRGGARTRRSCCRLPIACRATSHRGAVMMALLEGDRRQIERDQEILEQVLDDPDLGVQPMITLDQVQGSPIGLREAHAVLVGHDLAVTAGHEGLR